MSGEHDDGGEITREAGRIRGIKHELEAQVPPLAVSLDGQAFTFAAPVSMVLPTGGYVTVRTPAGPALGQVRDVQLEHTPGPQVPVSSGALAGMSMHVRFDRIVGTGAMLGAGAPFHDAPIEPAPPADVAGLLAAERPRGATLRLGQATLAPGVETRLDATGFGRHTFLCGQSGSGKSYAMGLLLEQLLLETDLPIVVLDPNSDATRLAELLPGTDPATRRALVGDRVAHRRAPCRRRGGRATAAAVLRPRLRDPAGASSGSTRCATARSTTCCGASSTRRPAGRRWRTSGAADRRAAAARRWRCALRNLGVLDWSIWARDAGDRGLLADLETGTSAAWSSTSARSGRPPERALVSAAVLADLWRRRADRRPVLVVIDEAHNVCPPDAATIPSRRSPTDAAVQIAGEGRKFGLHLVVATQRPLKVHENVLSQCDNLILMRMNSAGDLARLAELFSFVPPALLGRATSFGLGQALVAGRIAPHPMLVTTGGRIAQRGRRRRPRRLGAAHRLSAGLHGILRPARPVFMRPSRR